MMVLLSPAKSLDMEKLSTDFPKTQAEFLADSEKLVKALRKLSIDELQTLYKSSEKIAELNKNRFKAWRLPLDESTAKQAIFAFTGDVYQGLDATTMTEAQLSYAQEHLRILSGLYGMLRPFDLILPYRLEMGSRFSMGANANLYALWKEKLSEHLKQELKQSGDKLVLNLASEEYAKSIDRQNLGVPVIQPVFKDHKNGQFKIISVHAKKARGLMARYVFAKKVRTPEKLKKFDSEGYYFVPEASDQTSLVFHRQ